VTRTYAVTVGSVWLDRSGARFVVVGIDPAPPPTGATVSVRRADGTGPVDHYPLPEFGAFLTLPSGACAYRFTRTLHPHEVRPPRPA
jgi:hypothetical protein